MDNTPEDVTQLKAEIASLFSVLGQERAINPNINITVFEMIHSRCRTYDDLQKCIKETLGEYCLSNEEDASCLHSLEQLVQELQDYLHLLGEFNKHLPPNWVGHYEEWKRQAPKNDNRHPSFAWDPLRLYLTPIMTVLGISRSSTSRKRPIAAVDAPNANERPAKEAKVDDC